MRNPTDFCPYIPSALTLRRSFTVFPKERYYHNHHEDYYSRPASERCPGH